ILRLARRSRSLRSRRAWTYAQGRWREPRRRCRLFRRRSASSLRSKRADRATGEHRLKTAEPAPRRVLFFGDSLVAGVGGPAGGGWVARVVIEAFRSGVPLTAYNLGI